MKWLGLSLCGLLMGGCSTQAPVVEPHAHHGAPAAEWHAVPFPGKRPTHYDWVRKDGRLAWAARADGSASMWRRKVDVLAPALRGVRFAWRVDALPTGASVSDVDRSDAPARVMLTFDGDAKKLPARTRAMFELVQALTGEAPPYATLVYVWDASAPVGSVIVNGRTDRVRKIVVDSGTGGLRQWQVHRRDIAADFRRAFGEDPGALRAIALMTDADNTRQTAQAWYEPPRLVD